MTEVLLLKRGCALADAVDGVRSIELLPPTGRPGVVGRIRGVTEQSQRVRGAVAYWCLAPAAVSDDLVQRFAGDGFVCVDIHLPTDIDILCGMATAGANVYLHILDPIPQSGELRQRMPPYLLHPKVLLFDLDNSEAELWVGSHNWTARALTGLNIEGSLVLRLEQGAPIYERAVEFLDAARALCQPFNMEATAYYKWLQGQAEEEGAWVLDLEGVDGNLLEGKRITVFGRLEDEYKNLKNVDKNLMVSVLDPNSGREWLYRAIINDTGRTPGAGVTFDERLFAVQQAAELPRLEGPAVPDRPRLAQCAFWATVELKDQAFQYSSFEPPPTERWQLEPDDPFERRVDADWRRLFHSPHKPLVKRPVPLATFERRDDADARSSLARADGAVPLVRKKIIRLVRGLLNGGHTSANNDKQQ